MNTMKFVSDPPIAVKIGKMNQRVRWQEQSIVERSIDQTRFVLEGQDNPEFSFLVVGDSGSGSHRGYNPQREIAKLMYAQSDNCSFVLHTGDVIYLVGSSEYYPENFIKPYREFIVGGDRPEGIAYDKMVFKLPFLPVLGNHDYYDLPFLSGLIAGTTLPLRRLLRSQLDVDIGWRGSSQGKAYARAFLDYLKAFNPLGELGEHLDRHYTAKTDSGRCLLYEPERFTRLPNRYYTFRSGGIDFFALDSNTFNAPLPLPANQQGDDYRRLLEERRDKLEQEKLQILAIATEKHPETDEAEQVDDLRTKLEQLEELQIDIDKQLAADDTTTTDVEQLDWLRHKLIESWHNSQVRGRVLYFHHPPYVTEATKWHQGQTLAIRYRLRQVLDSVANSVGVVAERPIVDLILNGHAHCLEYLRTGNTGHADSHTNWIVCGGSGYSLRRQRTEGPELTEFIDTEDGNQEKVVARSLLYIGRSGQGAKKRRPYSGLKIDVQAGTPPKFIIRPFLAERLHRQWSHSHLEPFEI